MYVIKYNCRGAVLATAPRMNVLQSLTPKSAVSEEMALPIVGVDACILDWVAGVYHHAVAHIYADM